MKLEPALPMLLRKPLALVREFLRLESAGGLLLMAAALLALLLANSPAAGAYRAALATPLGLPGASLSLLHWVNDGLMAVFFLLVGLEIKRELLTGALSSAKRAALPAIAALGGMAVPALLYIAVSAGDPAALRGWAIPAATDIAFALGVLALLGERVPASLKVFLTALAILDDLGAIAIIAVFYTADLALPALGLAAAGLLVLGAFNRLGVQRLAPYLAVGALVWLAVLASGVHATLAGVAVAFLVPLRGNGASDDAAPLRRLEHRLHPWVAFGILPVFGLANAGVSFAGLAPDALLAAVPLGVAVGLFVGKQLGIAGFSWLAVRLGWAEWPAGASGLQLYGVAVLCGIGFTMSLFIGALAFESEALLTQTKLGVFAGSLLSALVGYLVLRFAAASTAEPSSPGASQPLPARRS